MAEYNILELDYQTNTPLSHDELLLLVKKGFLDFQNCFKADPVLMQMNFDQKDRFSAFFFGCNLVAAHSHATLSVAIDGDTGEASVVLIADRLLLNEFLLKPFSLSLQNAKRFAIEPVEEHGYQQMVYLVFDLFLNSSSSQS